MAEKAPIIERVEWPKLVLPHKRGGVAEIKAKFGFLDNLARHPEVVDYLKKGEYIRVVSDLKFPRESISLGLPAEYERYHVSIETENEDIKFTNPNDVPQALYEKANFTGSCVEYKAVPLSSVDLNDFYSGSIYSDGFHNPRLRDGLLSITQHQIIQKVKAKLQIAA